MNSCEWSEQVALVAGGDLDESALDGHLAHCPACRELLVALRSDREWLQTAPVVPVSVVSEVRANVLRRTRTHGRLWWAALAAALAIGAFWIGTPHRDAPAPPALVTHVKPDVQVPAVTTAPSVRPPRKQLRRSVPRPASGGDELMAAFAAALPPLNSAPAGPQADTVITASTADPDVVIVLIGELQGEVNE